MPQIFIFFKFNPRYHMLLKQGDCLEVMDEIETGSIDTVICDPPYGTTHCPWDSVIALEPMWAQLKRVIKPSSPIVLMAAQPFTTTLISSNMKMFRYHWVWLKTLRCGFASSGWRPLSSLEDICIFLDKPKSSTYNAQGLIRVDKPQNRKALPQVEIYHYDTLLGNYTTKYINHPHQLLEFNSVGRGGITTQKPVDLMEYLVNTYSNEGDHILDFAMGSGTTGVACKNLNRDFTGIELNPKHYEIACKRIDNQQQGD